MLVLLLHARMLKQNWNSTWWLNWLDFVQYFDSQTRIHPKTASDRSIHHQLYTCSYWYRSPLQGDWRGTVATDI